MTLNSILRRLGIYFPQPVSFSVVKQRKRETVKQVIAEHSRGNISLKCGNFITSQNVDSVRELNVAHDFCQNEK